MRLGLSCGELEPENGDGIGMEDDDDEDDDDGTIFWQDIATVIVSNLFGYVRTCFV